MLFGTHETTLFHSVHLKNKKAMNGKNSLHFGDHSVDFKIKKALERQTLHLGEMPQLFTAACASLRLT